MGSSSRTNNQESIHIGRSFHSVTKRRAYGATKYTHGFQFFRT
ncbi:hypothetical protein M758_10G085200 [Ceratodon purpureus]|nr:hypothetical protein M758_10G085200 [Ceratodon purpureus]